MKQLNTFEGGHPFSTSDLRWLNAMVMDTVANVTSMFLPRATDAAIISGCVLVGSGAAIVIQDGEPGDWTVRPAGKVIYQGKIFEVRSGEVTGSFSEPYASAVGLKVVNRTLGSEYPEVVYADSSVRAVYQEEVMELVASGWDVPLAGLSYVSNTAQAGTIVGFLPTGPLSDFVDPVTNLGKGRWRGWRRYTEANGRVLVGLDSSQVEFDTIGETGGAKTHLLTAAESGLPDHTHTYLKTSSTPGPSGLSGSDARLIDTATAISVDGGAQPAAQAHNNLQPYTVAVYMIKL